MAVQPISAVPTARLSFGRLAAINAFWFGGGAHWQPIYISLIPVGATLIAGSRADLLIGRVTAAGGIFALLTPILVGWLSDRTVSRWGRRRPWMVAGTVLNIIGLGLLALSTSQLTFIAAYLVVQLSNNAAGAAYTGVIPDVVRAEDRGRASGLLGTMNQLGTVVGVGMVGLTFKLYGDTRAGLLAGYGVVAVILVITLLITVVAVKEPVPPPPLAGGPVGPRERRFSARRAFETFIVGGAPLICAAAFVVALIALFAILLAPLGSLFWAVVAVFIAAGVVTVLAARRLPSLMAFFQAFRSNDFFWTFATRALVTLGIFSILPFMELYFRDVVRTKDAGAASAFWLLAVIAGAIIPSIVGGVLSDRTGRRKLFVYISSAMQAVVVSVLLFGLVRSLSALCSRHPLRHRLRRLLRRRLGARLRRPSQPRRSGRSRHGALARLLHPPPGPRARDPGRLSPLPERARPSAARNLERPRPGLSLHLRQRGAVVRPGNRDGQPHPRGPVVEPAGAV